MAIEYTETNADGLDLTNKLWRKLIKHHAAKSRHFSELIAKRTSEQRNQELLGRFEKGNIRIDLARDTETDELVGYCISTVSADNEGEVQSIYVEEDYRNNGIGDAMITRALCWMDERPVTRKVIAVAFGNEEVFPFYHQYNFLPRATILAQVGERGQDNT